VEDIDLHTLRHTFASHLVAAGVDLKTVGDLLGHTHIAVTAIYLHPFEQRKVDAVEKVPIPGGTLTEGATKRQAPLGIAAG
jgi:site-specific recombinase XerD